MKLRTKIFFGGLLIFILSILLWLQLLKQTEHASLWQKYKTVHGCIISTVTKVSSMPSMHLTSVGYEGAITVGEDILVVEEGLLWRCSRQDILSRRVEAYTATIKLLDAFQQ